MAFSREQLYAAWVEYCNSTDAHGFKRMVQHGFSMWRRYMWAVCCLASIGFLIFYSQDRVGRYLLYQVKTNLRKTNSNTMPMPAITICNKNEVSLSKYDVEDTERFLVRQAKYVANDNTSSIIEELKNDHRDQDGINQTIELLENYTSFSSIRSNDTGDFVYDEWLHRKGYTYDDIVVDCEYAGEKCAHSSFDGINNNETSLHFPYGQCVTINGVGKRNFVASRPGISMTLRVKMDRSNFNLIRMNYVFQKYGYNALSSFLPNSRPGLIAQIHHPSILPEFLTGKKFAIYNGDRISIIIDKMVVVRREKPPYMHCEDLDYRRCLKNCVYEYLDTLVFDPNSTCSVVAYDPPLEYWRNPSNRKFCKTDIDENFPYWLEIAYKKCLQDNLCSHKCEEIDYGYYQVSDNVNFRHEESENEDLCEENLGYFNNYYNFYNIEEFNNGTNDMSSILFPVNPIFPIMDSVNSDNAVTDRCKTIVKSRKKDGVALIRLEFQNLELEEVIYTPDYTFENLLAEVGGMMGLFIGLSALTIIHLVESLCYGVIMYWRKNSTISSSSTVTAAETGEIKPNDTMIAKLKKMNLYY